VNDLRWWEWILGLWGLGAACIIFVSAVVGAQEIYGHSQGPWVLLVAALSVAIVWYVDKRRREDG